VKGPNKMPLSEEQKKKFADFKAKKGAAPEPQPEADEPEEAEAEVDAPEEAPPPKPAAKPGLKKPAAKKPAAPSGESLASMAAELEQHEAAAAEIKAKMRERLGA
jgi:hypothetical protein